MAIISIVSVSVSPTAATVALGGTQAFHAVVTGAQDATVTWDVGGVVGGNATLGTILNSQTDPDNTTYTAPQSLPAGGSVTVRARSNANPNISASATITFTAAINVALSPTSAARAIGHSQTFTVQVNNTANQNVSWQVNGIAGGNSAAGQICVAGSNPCQQISTSNGGSVDYLAPAGLAISQPGHRDGHQPGRQQQERIGKRDHPAAYRRQRIAGKRHDVQRRPAAIHGGRHGHGQSTGDVERHGRGMRQFRSVRVNRFLGAICRAAIGAFSPNLITVVATSSEDTSQSGTATVTISGAPNISAVSPSSAYAGSAGGFTLEISGNNFAASSPGPGSTIFLTGTPAHHILRVERGMHNVAVCLRSAVRGKPCRANTKSRRDALEHGDIRRAGAGLRAGHDPSDAGRSFRAGKDIVVVELSTNGGSGAAGNVSLNVAAIGAYIVATSSCTLGGSPVVILRPATGTATADLCVFSVSGLDPSFTYTVSGPAVPDITISNREPLGLGIVHLTLQVPATAATGPRTLFVENPSKDKAAGTGAIEVR